MRRGQWFWGIVLIVVGALFLLESLGFLRGVSAWGLIWPLILISLGFSALYPVIFGRRAVEMEQISLPLEGAQRARLHLNYGAGRFRMGAGTSAENLLEGTFGGGLKQRPRHEGDTLSLAMQPPEGAGCTPPWIWGPGLNLDWDFKLNGDVPMELEMEFGACDAVLDLSTLQVRELKVKTGASSTVIKFPSEVDFIKADITSGAAAMTLEIPPHVAARIRSEGALADVRIDTERFPRSGREYLSSEYETASHKAEIIVNASVGSLIVR